MAKRSEKRMRPEDDFSEYFERGAKAIDEGWPYERVLLELREIIRDKITPPIARKGGISFSLQCFDKVTHLGMDFSKYLRNRSLIKNDI